MFDFGFKKLKFSIRLSNKSSKINNSEIEHPKSEIKKCQN
jgi:hypothetical protein